MDVDSERKAGGMRKSCDAGGHATLLPEGKGGFPLHRSEAMHLYVSVVQNFWAHSQYASIEYMVKFQWPSGEASTSGCHTTLVSLYGEARRVSSAVS